MHQCLVSDDNYGLWVLYGTDIRTTPIMPCHACELRMTCVQPFVIKSDCVITNNGHCANNLLNDKLVYKKCTFNCTFNLLKLMNSNTHNLIYSLTTTAINRFQELRCFQYQVTIAITTYTHKLVLLKSYWESSYSYSRKMLIKLKYGRLLSQRYLKFLYILLIWLKQHKPFKFFKDFRQLWRSNMRTSFKNRRKIETTAFTWAL